MTEIIFVTLIIILMFFIAWKPFLGIVFMFCTLPLQIYTQLPGISFSSVTAIFGLSSFISYILHQAFIQPRFKSSANAKPRRYKNGLFVGIILFYIMILVGEIFKPISTGLQYILTYFQLLVLVWLVPQLFTSLKKIETLMKFFIGTNIIAIIISLRSFSADSLNRLSGLQGNANEFAVYISIAILMLIYFLVSYPKKIISVILVGTLVVPLLFSGSRGAILFLLPAILLQLWLMRRNKYILYIFIVSGVTLLLGMTQMIIPDFFMQRLIQIPQDIIFGNETVGLRYSLWRQGLELWKEKPIFGIGTGLFVFYSKNLSIVSMSHPYGLVLHNMYITHLTENGIVGIVMFLFILIRSSLNFFKSMGQTLTGSFQRNISATWFSVYMYLLLNGIKGNYNLNKILWFCFAISVVFLTFSEYTKNKKILPRIKTSISVLANK